MTILKLAIDASELKQGAREAQLALEGVGRSAQTASSSIDIFTANYLKPAVIVMDTASDRAAKFGKTVEALGEVTQIQQRVKLLGQEISTLGSGMGNVASVAQNLSAALIDVAQISGKVEGGFRGFVALLTANPLLVAATVIGGIATAMSLFSGETKDANSELQQQIRLQEELKRTSQDLALQIQKNQDLQRIGFDINQREQELLRARRLAETASGLAGQGGFQTFADLQSLTGLTQEELIQRAGPAGIRQRAVTQAVPGLQTSLSTYENIGLTNEAARAIILEVAALIRRNAPEAQAFGPQPGAGFGAVAPGNLYPTVLAPTGYGAAIGPQPGPGFMTPEQLSAYQRGFGGPTVLERTGYPSAIGPQPGPDYMTPSELAAYQQRFAAPSVLPSPESLQQAEEELKQFNERLREMKTLGQDVGSAIGGAFFSIVNGAASARQALAGLLQSFVAIAQQRAIQGIANSVGNAFGSTVPQNNANAQTPGAGNTGTSLRAGT